MIHRRVPLLAVLAWAACAPAVPAHAQVNRCTAADGTSIYTDRACSELGAAERLPRRGEDAATGRNAYRGGCPRSVHALIHEMTWAIDNNDVNRLAAVYHWPGISNQAGYTLMGRLDRVARNALVDIVALRPAAAPPAPAPEGLEATFASTFQTAPPPAAPVQSRRPVALRVQQTTANGQVPTRTVFNLRQHIGCWWVSL